MDDIIGLLTAMALEVEVVETRASLPTDVNFCLAGSVTRQHLSGGKARHGYITKRVDWFLRTLPIHSASTLMRHLSGRANRKSCWVRALQDRRGFDKATIHWRRNMHGSYEPFWSFGRVLSR